MNHDQHHRTKMTSQKFEQVITDTAQKINHDEVIQNEKKDVFTDR